MDGRIFRIPTMLSAVATITTTVASVATKAYQLKKGGKEQQADLDRWARRLDLFKQELQSLQKFYDASAAPSMTMMMKSYIDEFDATIHEIAKLLEKKRKDEHFLKKAVKEAIAKTDSKIDENINRLETLLRDISRHQQLSSLKPNSMEEQKSDLDACIQQIYQQEKNTRDELEVLKRMEDAFRNSLGCPLKSLKSESVKLKVELYQIHEELFPKVADLFDHFDTSYQCMAEALRNKKLNEGRVDLKAFCRHLIPRIGLRELAKHCKRHIEDHTRAIELAMKANWKNDDSEIKKCLDDSGFSPEENLSELVSTMQQCRNNAKEFYFQVMRDKIDQCIPCRVSPKYATNFQNLLNNLTVIDPHYKLIEQLCGKFTELSKDVDEKMRAKQRENRLHALEAEIHSSNWVEPSEPNAANKHERFSTQECDIRAEFNSLCVVEKGQKTTAAGSTVVKRSKTARVVVLNDRLVYLVPRGGFLPTRKRLFDIKEVMDIEFVQLPSNFEVMKLPAKKRLQLWPEGAIDKTLTFAAKVDSLQGAKDLQRLHDELARIRAELQRLRTQHSKVGASPTVHVLQKTDSGRLSKQAVNSRSSLRAFKFSGPPKYKFNEELQQDLIRAAAITDFLTRDGSEAGISSNFMNSIKSFQHRIDEAISDIAKVYVSNISFSAKFTVCFPDHKKNKGSITIAFADTPALIEAVFSMAKLEVCEELSVLAKSLAARHQGSLASQPTSEEVEEVGIEQQHNVLVHAGLMQEAQRFPVATLNRLMKIALGLGWRIVFTGHSFGGAVAQLVCLRFLAHLHANVDDIDHRHKLYDSVRYFGFGVPNIGIGLYDELFERCFGSQMKKGFFQLFLNSNELLLNVVNFLVAAKNTQFLPMPEVDECCRNAELLLKASLDAIQPNSPQDEQLERTACNETEHSLAFKNNKDVIIQLEKSIVSLYKRFKFHVSKNMLETHQDIWTYHYKSKYLKKILSSKFWSDQHLDPKDMTLNDLYLTKRMKKEDSFFFNHAMYQYRRHLRSKHLPSQRSSSHQDGHAKYLERSLFASGKHLDLTQYEVYNWGKLDAQKFKCIRAHESKEPSEGVVDSNSKDGAQSTCFGPEGHKDCRSVRFRFGGEEELNLYIAGEDLEWIVHAELHLQDPVSLESNSFKAYPEILKGGSQAVFRFSYPRGMLEASQVVHRDKTLVRLFGGLREIAWTRNTLGAEWVRLNLPQPLTIKLESFNKRQGEIMSMDVHTVLLKCFYLACAKNSPLQKSPLLSNYRQDDDVSSIQAVFKIFDQVETKTTGNVGPLVSELSDVVAVGFKQAMAKLCLVNSSGVLRNKSSIISRLLAHNASVPERGDNEETAKVPKGKKAQKAKENARTDMNYQREQENKNALKMKDIEIGKMAAARVEQYQALHQRTRARQNSMYRGSGSKYIHIQLTEYVVEDSGHWKPCDKEGNVLPGDHKKMLQDLQREFYHKKLERVRDNMVLSSSAWAPKTNGKYNAPVEVGWTAPDLEGWQVNEKKKMRRRGWERRLLVSYGVEEGNDKDDQSSLRMMDNAGHDLSFTIWKQQSPELANFLPLSDFIRTLWPASLKVSGSMADIKLVRKHWSFFKSIKELIRSATSRIVNRTKNADNKDLIDVMGWDLIEQSDYFENLLKGLNKWTRLYIENLRLVCTMLRIDVMTDIMGKSTEAQTAMVLEKAIFGMLSSGSQEGNQPIVTKDNWRERAQQLAAYREERSDTAIRLLERIEGPDSAQKDMTEERRATVCTFIGLAICIYQLREILTKHFCFGVLGPTKCGKSKLLERFGFNTYSTVFNNSVDAQTYYFQGLPQIAVLDSPGMTDARMMVRLESVLTSYFYDAVILLLNYDGTSDTDRLAVCKAALDHGRPTIICLNKFDGAVAEIVYGGEDESRVREHFSKCVSNLRKGLRNLSGASKMQSSPSFTRDTSKQAKPKIKKEISASNMSQCTGIFGTNDLVINFEELEEKGNNCLNCYDDENDILIVPTCFNTVERNDFFVDRMKTLGVVDYVYVLQWMKRKSAEGSMLDAASSRRFDAEIEKARATFREERMRHGKSAGLAQSLSAPNAAKLDHNVSKSLDAADVELKVEESESRPHIDEETQHTALSLPVGQNPQDCVPGEASLAVEKLQAAIGNTVTGLDSTQAQVESPAVISSTPPPQSVPTEVAEQKAELSDQEKYEKEWCILRKLIPEAEKDKTLFCDFVGMTTKELEEVIEEAGVPKLKRGAIRRLHASGNQ